MTFDPNNKKKKTSDKREYKGNKPASEILVQETFKNLEETFTTNNQIFLLRNLTTLLNRGMEDDLMKLMSLLIENGNNVTFKVKDNDIDATALKDLAIPAENISYAMPLLMAGIWKEKVDAATLDAFASVIKKLIDDLKNTEEDAINLIAKGDISVKSVPSVNFKRRVNQKREKLLKEKRDAEQRKEEQAKRKREKNKRKREAAKKKKEALNNTPPNDVNETKNDKQSEITPVEVKKIELPPIDSKTIDEWKEFATENKIDLTGLTIKSEIYEKIQKDV